MESIFLHLYKITVLAFYGYLAWLYFKGIRTMPPRKWWIIGAVFGLLVGTLWAAAALFWLNWAPDLYIGLTFYILAGLPLSFPLYPYLLTPSYLKGADHLGTVLWIQALLTVVSAILVVGTVYGSFMQRDKRGRRTAKWIIVGLVSLATLTFIGIVVPLL